MNNPDSRGERSIALFLLGILLFNPPLLSIFGTDVAFAGVPLLYIYLFVAWAIFIFLIGVNSEMGKERRRSLRVPQLPGNDNPAAGVAVPQGSLPHSISPRPNLTNQTVADKATGSVSDHPATRLPTEREDW
ncbi:hypothetical protein [Pelagibius sp. Alg239-R121]|uniref:hypothetical protein n=1 Tax=Pelagibius sp. Alg239-R121 TaxID=2993448 RepID=UPI0024A7477F|nr:hypothetical protein [Pelagibius sp. Alg239-R121]